MVKRMAPAWAFLNPGAESSSSPASAIRFPGDPSCRASSRTLSRPEAPPQARRGWPSTDLSTARQKFQRAFAAEFLCPIDELKAFLDDDYSESAIEDAAAHFDVSERTVESPLANNGVLSSVPVPDVLESRPPYPLGI